MDHAITALLEGRTREQAAAAAGVDPATLYRWLNKPEFQAHLLKSRREAFGLAMGRVQQGATTAAGTLVAIMSDEDAPVTARVQACKCVLELSRKSIELDDLAQQVAELQEWRRSQEQGSD